MKARAPASALAALLLAAAPAAADEALLANGVRMTGVLVSSDAATLTLQVADGGTVVLDTVTVRELTLSSPGDDATLRAAWRKERLETEAREKAQRAFEDAQRAKGLVLYDGTWMSPLDAARLDAALRGPEDGGWRPGAAFVVRAPYPRRPPSLRLLSSGWTAPPVRSVVRHARETRPPGRIMLRYHAPGVSGPLRTGFNLGVPSSFEIPY